MGELRETRNEKRRGFAGAFFSLLLTLLPVLAFYRVHLRYYREATFYFKGNYLLTLIYAFLLILLLSMYGAYRLRQTRTRELAFSFALASFLTNLIFYFILSLIARRMLRVTPLLLMLLVQWVMAVAVYVLARILIPHLEPDIPAVYICSSHEKEDPVLRKFDNRRTSYSVQETVPGDLPPEELKRAIEPYAAVLLGDLPLRTRQEIISYCFRTGRRSLLLPSMTDILVGSASPLVIGDTLIYDLNTQGSNYPYLVAKRLTDILASAAGLLVLSPLMLITALAVKLQDGGPVFYRQTRLTRGGRRFQLTKFRSMIPNAEKGTGAVLAGKEDSRITPVGRIIRAARIDELPQLWNILKGDMTLVGPRPERPEFYERICAEFPEFDYRLKVKAGLTGYAQLYGKYNTTFVDKVRLDMYYIQHASFLWDLQLIFYTLKIIFIRESTEGVESTEETSDPARETVAR